MYIFGRNVRVHYVFVCLSIHITFGIWVVNGSALRRLSCFFHAYAVRVCWNQRAKNQIPSSDKM